MSQKDNQPVEDENLSEEGQSAGQMLREAREEQELAIEQLAGDLRVETHCLVAFEEDRFDAYSAPVFTKGYLKQYALRLGLDASEVLAAYTRQVGKQDVPRLRSLTIEPGDDRQQARWLIAGSTVALIIAVFAVWRFGTPEPDPPIVQQPAPTVPATEVSAPVVAPAQPAVPATPVVPVTPEPLSEATGPTLLVEIAFNEDCWTEVIDASGERMFYGLGSAGARAQFMATPPLSFFLGNASGVDLSVNEMPYEIPMENREGNLARFVILESGD